MALATLAFVTVPIVAAAALTATFAGWASVAVAVVFWIAFLVVGTLLFRFAFRGFRSVRGLIDSTGRLAEGDYSARVSSEGPTAMRPVLDAFNSMAERLEMSDDLRRRLLADVGHELRTPLTIVRGELEAMADGVRELNEAEVRVLLDDIAVMERLLDDLRTLSTTEAGMVDLHREPVELGELVADVLARFAPQADAAGVRLVAAADAPVEVDADRFRLNQVLSNLVANALRAVDRGDEIVVTVDSRRVDDRDLAAMVIADTGRGIPADRLAAVFDRFQKGAESNGSGLGLTISRDLVVAHGGSIEIESEVGRGTTVTVALPI